MEPEAARRRMRAARAIAGLSVRELARLIPEENRMGERTLRKLESGESELRPKEMREIAHACGLPYEFFTADFNVLVAPHHANNLAERMDELTEELHERMERLERELSQALVERAAGEAERAADTPDTSAADKPARLPVDPR